MTITQAESGLSNDEYAALTGSSIGPAYRVTRYAGARKMIGMPHTLDNRYYAPTTGLPAPVLVVGFDALEFLGKLTYVSISDVIHITQVTPTFGTGIHSGTLADTQTLATATVTLGAPTPMPIASLATNGSLLRLFYVASNGFISYRDSTDGLNFGSEVQFQYVPWDRAITDSTISQTSTVYAYVNFLAATSPTCVHVARYYRNSLGDGGDGFCYRFYTYEYAPSTAGTQAATWYEIYSDITWQHRMHEMDAVRYNGQDIILVSTFLPERPGVKTVGRSVQKLGYSQSGLISFRYSLLGRSWSDHYRVDTLDMTGPNLFRVHGRLSIVDNLVVATAVSQDGADYLSDQAIAPFGSVRTYTTKDGRFWSSGRILYDPWAFFYVDKAAHDSDVYLRPNGYKLVGQDGWLMRFSWYSYQVGAWPHIGPGTTAGQFDLTPLINDYSASVNDSFQSSLTLNRFESDGLADLGTLHLSGAEIVQPGDILTHEWGYFSASAGVPYYVLVATTEVDSVEIESQTPVQNIIIHDRDRLAWMSDKYKSEQSYQWNDPGVGYDTWSDTTNTGYGGMTHSADQSSGTLRTDGGGLIVSSNNVQAIAFSTFVDEMWNGGSEVFLSFPASADAALPSTSQYAGIVFRARDKDNYWQVILYPSLIDGSTGSVTFPAQIRVKEIRGGVIQTEPSGVAIGTIFTTYNPGTGNTPMLVSANNSNQPIGLRVRFHYGTLDVYFAPSNSVNWYWVGTYLMYGSHITPDPIHTPGWLKKSPQDSGFVGQIGLGYSDTDTWPVPDAAIISLVTEIDQSLYPTPLGVPFLPYGLNNNSAHLDVGPGLAPVIIDPCSPLTFPVGWTIDYGTTATPIADDSGYTPTGVMTVGALHEGSDGSYQYLFYAHYDVPAGKNVKSFGMYLGAEGGGGQGELSIYGDYADGTQAPLGACIHTANFGRTAWFLASQGTTADRANGRDEVASFRKLRLVTLVSSFALYTATDLVDHMKYHLAGVYVCLVDA